MPVVMLPCAVCKGKHDIELNDQEAREGRVVIMCPDLDRRYRFVSLFIDARRGILETPVAAKFAESEAEHLKQMYGAEDFDKKLARWKNIKYPTIALIEEYREKIGEIIDSYTMGNWYPAVTSACCLGERILNRLVLKCRHHFKGHREYKKIYNKESFDDWGRMLDLIEDWQLISARAIELFRELAPIRHETIHYNDGYDFKGVAESVINKLIEAVTEVFGVMNRPDIFLVFDVPGEIWVRSAAEQLPFVREFVLPHCYRAHAVHEYDFATGTLTEKLGKTGLLTDAEFVELRKGSTAVPGTAG